MNSQPLTFDPAPSTEGWSLIEEAIRTAVRPDPVLTVSQWADRYRFLSTKLAAEAGPYRTERTPYLREIMDCLSPFHPARRVVFMKGAQVGAPLALDTPIPTPSGWTTMGEIAPGDEIFDETGRVVLVDGVSPVFHDRDCYRVVFSDGESITADASHLWTVDDSPGKELGEKTLTTAEIAERYKIRGRNRYAIPLPAPLDLPAADLPIGPYTFGVWLGDGNSASNQITTHRDDAAEMAGYMTNDGHETIVRCPHWVKGNCLNLIIEPKQPRGNICRRGHDMTATGVYHVRRRGRVDLMCAECSRQQSMFQQYGKPRDPVLEEPGPWFKLKSLGVIGNKHILGIYLRASVEQRLALLQGLMDTDGSVDHRGRCELTVADEGLAADCVELIRSLGFKPTTSKRQTNEVVQGRPVKNRKWHTRISFMAYAERPVFRLRRKLERMVTQDGKRTSETFRRRIVAVEPVSSVPTRCISVASARHLFLAGRGMIATHNTEAGNNWLGYIIHWSPAPVMGVWPTVDTAKKVSTQRIEPLIEESPELSRLIPPAKSRDSGNTQLVKSFPGGVLVMTGANSGVGLRSMPARYAFLDEVDAYPGDVDGEGDPIALVANRTTTFGRSAKMFLVSTPTTHGTSRIEREFMASDQRRYFVPCPHCQERQWLKFERLQWERGRPESAVYVCEHCGACIEERHKATMLPAGVWEATAEATDRQTVGFHISALYSPLGWMSWADIAREWEAAQGNTASLKAFKNTRLGETWYEESEAVDWQRVYERREPIRQGVLAKGVTHLIGACDVQRDRIELHIWGFGAGLEAWAVDRIIAYGRADVPETWHEIEDALERTWKHESGARLRLDLVAVDTGDQSTTVYEWIAKQDQARVMAIKGKAGYDANAPVSTPTYVALGRRKRAIRLRTVTGDVFKADLYRKLEAARPTDEELAENGWPVGWVHVPDYFDAEWCRQLTAERRVRTKTGRFEWKKEHERNEVLDCYVYARAALWTIGVAGWTSDRWMKERDKRGLDLVKEEEAPPAPLPPPPKTVNQLFRRRATRSGFMGR